MFRSQVQYAAADILQEVFFPSDIFCRIAKFSAILCACDVILLGFTAFFWRGVSKKQRMMFLVVSLLMHLLDTKTFFHFNGKMCGAGLTSEWWFGKARVIWGIRFVSVFLAFVMALRDLRAFPFTLFKRQPSTTSEIETTKSIFVPHFESIWLRRTWALYSAGAYLGYLGYLGFMGWGIAMVLALLIAFGLVLFALSITVMVINLPQGLVDEVVWLGKVIYSPWV